MTRACQTHLYGALAMIAAGVVVLALPAIATPLVSQAEAAANQDDSDELFSSPEETVNRALAEPEAEPTGEPALATDEINGAEVIHERFPSRLVKIERYVAQDDDGNYFNQGSWTQWDEKGRLVARGNYQTGKRHGKWFRWYDGGNPDLFSGQDFQAFQRPFGTTAEFVNDELHGTWKVFDAQKRPVCEWHFVNGQRDGHSVWYTHSGQVRQEVNFKNGQMDGELKHLDAEGKLVVRERYVDGHRVTLEVSHHSIGQKKSQGEMLHAVSSAVDHYDWWAGSGQSVTPPSDLPKLRHGQWTWWYPNGQKQLEGRYENDQPVGKFAWWYPNGQCQLTGEYENGVQNGKFVWWYSIGQKQREGDYAAGVPIGNWMQWTPEGKVVQTEDYRTRSHVQRAPTHPEKLENLSTVPVEKDSGTTIGSAGRARR